MIDEVLDTVSNFSNRTKYVPDSKPSGMPESDWQKMNETLGNQSTDGSTLPLVKIDSKKVTVNNLATEMTAIIREKIRGQKMISVPADNFDGANYMGGGGTLSLIPTIDAQISNAHIAADEQKEALTSHGLSGLIPFGLLKEQADRQQHSVDKASQLAEVSLRIGDCHVFNPPWQFGELDDVRSDNTYPNLGRVYKNYIFTNYPQICFQPGREKINVNFMSFFGKGLFSDSSTLNEYIRTGGEPGILGSIKLGFATVKNTFLAGIDSILSWTGFGFTDASKYISFKPAMKLFRTYCNTLFREFAADLGLLDLSSEKNNGSSVEFDISDDAEKYNQEIADIYKNNQEFFKEMKYNKKGNTLEAAKEIYGASSDPTEKNSKTGSDPVSGINRSDSRKSVFGDRDIPTIGSYDKKTRAEIISAFGASVEDAESVDKGFSAYRGSIKHLDLLDMIPGIQKHGWKSVMPFEGYANANYLSFMCQNGVTVSETFSNSTKEHPLVQQINSLAESTADSKNVGGADDVMNALTGGGTAVDKLIGFVDKKAKRFAGEVVSEISEMGMIINGGGRLLIPELWSSSSYSRNYSVDFKFFSPVGDKVSIFENVFIPFIILLTLSSPLQTGYNAFMSPFICKVYSKGLFSIDMGMIESMSVTRGEDKNDRSIDDLPRSIKVSLSIKDLSPVMMLSIGGMAFWKYTRANSAMSEYIATLCGFSIAERLDLAKRFNKFWAAMTAGTRDMFSLNSIGYSMSQSFLFKPVMAWNKSAVSIDGGYMQKSLY